uniref:dUTPase-like domain-containing protein n=1 Tax=Otarine gammaherpesvirus 4 TaxID=2801541 RepID=A0A8B6T2V5_9GAMA|nr:hypothetical protein [Otarine gammaherpesvirus 4]
MVVALFQSATMHPVVYYKKQGSKFTLQSIHGNWRLFLVNDSVVLLSPHRPCVLPLGVYVTLPPGYAAFIIGHAGPDITCHCGLVDPGYDGELKLIINVCSIYNVALWPGRLRVYITAFEYSTPMLLVASPLTRPRYHLDAGFDLRVPYSFTIYPHQSSTVTIRSPCPAPVRFFKPVVVGRSGLAASGVTVRVTRWRNNNLKILVYNHTENTVAFDCGARFCQVVFIHHRHLPAVYVKCLKHMKLGDSVPFTCKNVRFEGMSEVLPSQRPPPALNGCDLLGALKDKYRGEKRGAAGFGSSGV